MSKKSTKSVVRETPATKPADPEPVVAAPAADRRVTLMVNTVIYDGKDYYELLGDVEAKPLTSESEESRRAKSVFPVQEIPEPEAFRPAHPKPEVVHGDGPRSSTTAVYAG